MKEYIRKQNANRYFWPELNGNCKQGWVLHHKDPNWRYLDPERYHQWNVEDLIPMTNLEHRRWHAEHSSYLSLDEIKFARRNMEVSQKRKRKENLIEAIEKWRESIEAFKKWREQKPNEIEKEPPKDESYSKDLKLNIIRYENKLLKERIKELMDENKKLKDKKINDKALDSFIEKTIDEMFDKNLI